MARETDVAVEAVLRQRVPLVEAELHLPLRGDERQQVRLLDVAEAVARLDEVVARIDVAGVLEREREPARLGVHAEPGRLADPVRERDVEHLDVDLADVAPHPFLEDVDQEAAVLLGADRPVRDLRAFLQVQGPVAPRRLRRAVLLGQRSAAR